jgi:glycerophosphoryl diester phosphodiesterase
MSVARQGKTRPRRQSALLQFKSSPSGWYAFRVWRQRPRAEPPLILAHRGASAVETENTVAAFNRARADGADGVELDVLQCGTGEVVVFHDDDLVRLAHRPERIGVMSWTALRDVELPRGARIPTLEQAVEACGPDLLINVELKANGFAVAAFSALVERTAAIVEQMRIGERVLVSSFNPIAVWLWMRRAPAVRAALLFEAGSPRPLRRAWGAPLLRPFALHPDFALCRPDDVAGWRRRGYMVNTWTVDDPGALAACRDMHIDGVITNDPAKARAALKA